MRQNKSTGPGQAFPWEPTLYKRILVQAIGCLDGLRFQRLSLDGLRFQGLSLDLKRMEGMEETESRKPAALVTA